MQMSFRLMPSLGKHKRRTFCAAAVLLFCLAIALWWLDVYWLDQTGQNIYASVKPGMPKSELYNQLHQRGFLTKDLSFDTCRLAAPSNPDQWGQYTLVEASWRLFPHLVTTQFDLCVDTLGNVAWLSQVDN